MAVYSSSFFTLFDKRKMPFTDHLTQSYREEDMWNSILSMIENHFGLQSGGRTESILMSMPPVANWIYDWTLK